MLHLDALETHPTHDEPDFTSFNEEYWQQDPVATVKGDDEEELIVYDHYTGIRLPSDGVKAARKDDELHGLSQGVDACPDSDVP